MARDNERGNTIYEDSEADRKLRALAFDADIDPYDRSRYDYDTGLGAGWKQYDTSQDAHYFGVWVNVPARLTFTYCEGDRIFVECPTPESFRAELADMERCYGPAPRAAVAYGADGTVTEYFDERPTA